jgi:hypothetical protein
MYSVAVCSGFCDFSAFGDFSDDRFSSLYADSDPMDKKIMVMPS